MPFGVIIMCCMSGCGLTPLWGMVDASSFLVNTDWKCWFSRLALVRLSDRMNPSLSCTCSSEFLIGHLFDSLRNCEGIWD